MKTKICSKCKEEKELSDFGKDFTRKDGFSYLCKLCLCKKSDTYRKNNQEKVTKAFNEYKRNNPEKRKESRKKYVENHKEKITAYRTYYSNKRRKESDVVRMSENIRRRVNHILKSKSYYKTNKTFDIVGCSPEFLKEYLESKFTDNMSWDNYGFYGWHIDHIIPLSSAKNEEELKRLCHYTNLQPLWCTDNLSKGSKIL
jgi:hypothetical protein